MEKLPPIPKINYDFNSSKKWNLNDWYYYYQNHIDNIFNRIMFIINRKDNLLDKDDINELYEKFVIFLYQNSTKYKSDFINSDSIQVLEKIYDIT